MLRRRNKRRQEILGIKPGSTPTTRALEEPNNEDAVCRTVSQDRGRQHTAMASFQDQRISGATDAKFERSSSDHNNGFNDFNNTKSNGSEMQSKLEERERGATPGKEKDPQIDDEDVVDIKLIFCHHCQKSYAPATYKKFCQTLDENGIPKCVSMRNKKRRIYNSAKVSLKI